MNWKNSHLKRATAATVVVALVLCQGFVTGTPLAQVVSKLQNYVNGASTAKAVRLPSTLRLPAAAHLSARGAVTLNGHAAPTGATVFSGGGVKTTENSSATLSFGAAGQVELSSASDFTLALAGTTLGGQLRAGSATIVAPAGIAVKLMTADGPVVTNGKEAVVLTVDVTGGKTHVETSGVPANVTAPASVEIVPDAPAGTPAQDRTTKTLAELRQAARDAADAAKAAIAKVRADYGRRASSTMDILEGFASKIEEAANAPTSAVAKAALIDAQNPTRWIYYGNLTSNLSDPSMKAHDAARLAIYEAFKAAQAVAEALRLAEIEEANAKAKAKANNGNGGSGPSLKDTLLFTLSAAGVALSTATLVTVQDQNNLSPMAPGSTGTGS